MFSIGEMAKIHHVSTKTLRHYDDLGLLKPIWVNADNGYRYYSTEQFEQLNTIQYLKDMGFSLKTIKDHFDHRSIDRMISMLEAQKASTEQKIQELQNIQLRFQHRLDDLHAATKVTAGELGVVQLKTMGDRPIVRLMEDIQSEYEIELSLRKLENLSRLHSSIFIGGVGLTVDQQALRQGDSSTYNSIFLYLEKETAPNELITHFPAGTYATLLYRGEHEQASRHYKTLFEYLRENNLHLAGDAIERTIVDHYISHDENDHLTEIQLPVHESPIYRT
ncbi:MerR family transcriptional regulator [Salibacterium lacus]|uniref:MerR family transcriptional regulator n=1 Tax=Salibacterium lacus TaxID=1898109 RepID=A0ABW5T3E6_9BACI